MLETAFAIDQSQRKTVTRVNLLVAVVLEVFLVAVVLEHMLRIVLPQPLGLVDVERAGLGLHLLALATPGNRCRQTWGRRKNPRFKVHPWSLRFKYVNESTYPSDSAAPSCGHLLWVQSGPT